MHEKKYQPALEALAGFFLEQEMAIQGISVADLAARSEIGLDSLVNELRLGVPSRRLRSRLENRLGFRSIWSSTAEICFRQRASDLFGLDPGIASLKEIKVLCQRLGIPEPSVRQREAWVTALAGWMAAHPKQKRDESIIERNKQQT